MPVDMAAPSPIDTCVALLAELIAHRTVSPGGDELGLCRALGTRLAAHGPEALDVVDVGRDAAGTCGYVFARWGTPRTLINVHLDTVPPNAGWTRDPFCAAVEGGRVTGLGAADTKGAIAALLTALERATPRDLGVLFSGDEERRSFAMREFLASGHARGVERAVVCEPSARRAGVRHRGVLAYHAAVQGRGGHSSRADHMPKPVVTMARLALALDELGATYLSHGPPDMRGVCLNVASLDGGVAFNVVPDRAALTWSLRPPPGFDRTGWDRRLGEAVAAIDPAIEVTCVIDNPPLAEGDLDGYRRLLGDHVTDFVPLDFWTEAALLAAAGIDAIVVGPGDIAQAHAADEFVTIDDLGWAVELFARVIAAADPAGAEATGDAG
jgi:acetylornithine deacetylase